MSRNLMCVIAAVVTLAFAGQAEGRSKRRVISPPEPEFNVAWTEGGYADATSVGQGQSIRLRIATSSSPFTLKIVNLADPTKVVWTRSLTSSARNCSGRAAQGCEWPVSVIVDVPQSWPSGYYAAQFPTAFGQRNIIFAVRDSIPGSYSRIVVISPTHTYQAYNEYGGRSFYPSDFPNRANELSLNRPYVQGDGLGRYLMWERYFVDFMTREGRRFEVITDDDMEDPAILSRYDLVVIAGHSEYWTSAARANLEKFSRDGGHIAVLGGNTMWWQVRLQNNGRSLIGYKDDADEYDPALQGAANLVTTNFYAFPVNQPENRILGASFRNGGYANRLDTPTGFDLKPLEQRTPFRVVDASHWVFQGTGLTNGSVFGRESAGLEVDGAVFNCDRQGNVLGPDGSDETPLNYHILAVLPGSMGWGTLGYYVNSAGGAVFNAAAQHWVWGLESNETVQRITRNVLARLGTGARQMYDPVPDRIVAQDTFNCPQTLIALPGWRSTVGVGRGTVTQACAYEGPGGLELSGQEIALSRSIAPAGSPRNHVELRFYINTDAMAQRTVFPMPVVTLANRAGNTVRQVAMVEVDMSGGTRRIRIARRGPDGRFAGPATWIDLSPGWHLVEATWRSPGTMELVVDGTSKLTLDNPFSGQTANEMVIELPKPEVTDAGRVCIDAIAAATQKLGGVPALQ
jgi:hypothetical protein